MHKQLTLLRSPKGYVDIYLESDHVHFSRRRGLLGRTHSNRCSVYSCLRKVMFEEMLLIKTSSGDKQAWPYCSHIGLFNCWISRCVAIAVNTKLTSIADPTRHTHGASDDANTIANSEAVRQTAPDAVEPLSTNGRVPCKKDGTVKSTLRAKLHPKENKG